MAPGARLHVLTVGVSDYGQAATHLKLSFAAADATDVAAALLNTQKGLYADVHPQRLSNQDATRAGILRGLATMRQAMARGEPGRDLAVVHFSGHGTLLDGEFYLLPHEVDAGDPVAIKATALSASDLRRELEGLAQYGRVLVLLDACRSGGAMASGQALAADATRLRAALVGPNITVLTSSSAAELSREDPTVGQRGVHQDRAGGAEQPGGCEPQRPDQHQRAHRLPDAPRARLDRRRPAPWGGDALRRRRVRRRALRGSAGARETSMKRAGSQMTTHTRVTCRVCAAGRPRFEGVTLADDGG